MLRLLFLAVAALSLTAAGCRTAQPADASAPDSTGSAPTPAETAPPGDARAMGPGVGDPLTVVLGETAERDGHAIRFVSVVEDSRCPADVTCVWEGRAKVALTIDGTATTLTVPYGVQQDDEPSMLEIGMIAVEVVGLDPFPGTPEAAAGQPVTVRLVTRHAGM